MRSYLLVLALATALPSAWLAYQLVQHELFRSRATAFARDEFRFERAHVADTRVDPKQRSIEVSLIGLPLDKPTLQRIEGRLAVAGLPDTKMLVHQNGENDRIDVTALKSSLLSDLYRDSQQALQKKDADLAALRERIAARDALMNQADAIAAELRTLVPDVAVVTISQGYRIDEGAEKTPVLQMIVQTGAPVSEEDRTRTLEWFKARTKMAAVDVLFDTVEPQPPA